MTDNKFNSIDEWLQYGIDRKWISAPQCVTHECLPLTSDEESAIEEYDICIIGARVYEEEQ